MLVMNERRADFGTCRPIVGPDDHHSASCTHAGYSYCRMMMPLLITVGSSPPAEQRRHRARSVVLPCVPLMATCCGTLVWPAFRHDERPAKFSRQIVLIAFLIGRDHHFGVVGSHSSYDMASSLCGR